MMLVIWRKSCLRLRLSRVAGAIEKRRNYGPLRVGQWLPLFGHGFVAWSLQSWHDSQPFSIPKHALKEYFERYKKAKSLARSLMGNDSDQ